MDRDLPIILYFSEVPSDGNIIDRLNKVDKRLSWTKSNKNCGKPKRILVGGKGQRCFVRNHFFFVVFEQPIFPINLNRDLNQRDSNSLGERSPRITRRFLKNHQPSKQQSRHNRKHRIFTSNCHA